MACGRFVGAAFFLGYGLSDQTPDRSTISRTRRLIDVETPDGIRLGAEGAG